MAIVKERETERALWKKDIDRIVKKRNIERIVKEIGDIIVKERER